MLIQDKKTSVNHHESFLSRLTGNFAYGLPFSARRGVTRTEDSRVRPRQANLTVTQGQGQIPIAILHLDGPLNASCYLDLIAKAKEIYGAGTRYIVLDMSDIPSVGSSSILALHSIAVVLRGEEPLDPQGGWGSLRAMANELETGSLGKQLKLFNPKPQVRETLEQASFVGFLEIHTDLDTAITSCQTGRWH